MSTTEPAQTNPLSEPLPRTTVLALVLTGLLGLFTLWWPTWPPLFDLPQHGAQVAWMLRFEEAGPVPYRDLFWINLLTPYLFGYGVAWLLAHVVSVGVALKLVLTGYIVGFVVGCRALLKEVGAEPRLLALMVPVAMGMPYQWGFLNYLVGLPLLLGVTVLSVRQARSPTLTRSVVIGAALLALVPVHAFVSLVAGAIGGAMAVSHPRPWRARIPLAAPFTLPLAGAAIWSRIATREEGVATLPVAWVDLGERLPKMMSNIVHAEADPVSMAMGVGCLIVVVLISRPVERLWRWTPILLLVVLCAALPTRYLGTYFLADRLAPLLVVFLAMAMGPRWKRPPVWVDALLLLLPVGWMLGMVSGVVEFERSLGDYKAVYGTMVPEQRVLWFHADRPDHLPRAHLHLPAWYAVDRGGLVETGFWTFPHAVVRYVPGEDPHLSEGFSFDPDEFDYELHRGDRWDYFFFRSNEDPSPQFFAGVTPSPVLVEHQGAYWLYRRPGRR